MTCWPSSKARPNRRTRSKRVEWLPEFSGRFRNVEAPTEFLADNRPGDEANGSMTNGLDSESDSETQTEPVGSAERRDLMIARGNRQPWQMEARRPPDPVNNRVEPAGPIPEQASRGGQSPRQGEP